MENVHFYKEINPKFIAYRSCAIALSDINAMGGRPLGYQVSLSTKETNTSFYRDLAKGFKLFSKKYGIGLIGGDITRGQFQLSITIIGEPHKKAIKEVEQGMVIVFVSAANLVRGNLQDSPQKKLYT